eukprot:COSAG01_NODE_31095_length_603_cov_202.666667_1_plen_39_part_10
MAPPRHSVQVASAATLSYRSQIQSQTELETLLFYYGKIR